MEYRVQAPSAGKVRVEKPLGAWLAGQQVPNSIVATPHSGRRDLIISYEVPASDPAHEFVFNRSWIYDCALAVIAFSMTKSFDRAERLLTALSGLIDEDGKLGFSYNTQDGWFEKKYWTGAIAWVGYSFVFYQNTTGDNQFQAFAVKIADWVISMQVAGKGSFRGSPDVSWISTEHNIDAYFFLRDIGRITGKIAYVTASHEIRTALLNFHWNSSFGCFQQGDADDTKALDTASWGALFLQSFQFLTPPGGSSIDSCLAFADANFAISKSCTIQGVPRTVAGYTPYSYSDYLWSEGSLGVALAYRRSGNIDKYNHILAQVFKMRVLDGGIVYACPTDLTAQVHDWQSVAGTAWMMMVLSPEEPTLWSKDPWPVFTT